MHQIKKYPNRRMYDNQISAYVNMQQIVDWIRQGEQVQIVDSRTGQDVTVETLISQVMTADLWEVLCPTQWLLELIALKEPEDQRQYLQYKIIQRQTDFEEDSITEEHSVEVTEILYTDKLPKLHPLNASRITSNSEGSQLIESTILDSAIPQDAPVSTTEILATEMSDSEENSVDWMKPFAKPEHEHWSDSDEEHTVISVSFPNLLELDSQADSPSQECDVDEPTAEKIPSVILSANKEPLTLEFSSQEELSPEAAQANFDAAFDDESSMAASDFEFIDSESEAQSEIVEQETFMNHASVSTSVLSHPVLNNPESSTQDGKEQFTETTAQAEISSKTQEEVLAAKMAALRAQFDL